MLVLAMAVTLAGCSEATTGGSSTTGTTAGKTTEAASTTAATTVATTVAVSDAYGLDKLTGDLPSVSEPAEKDEDRSKSEDGKWAIDNNCTIDGDKIIVNSTDGTAAFYGGQSLGTVWNASTNFRPIKTYQGDNTPVCARLFINNAEGAEVLLLTVNFMDKSAENVDNQVGIMLQVYNGKKWKTLYDSNGWVETKSTKFHFGVSRAEGSKKVSFVVAGDQGEIVNRETVAEVDEALLDSIVAAGVGVYSSAVEYSSFKVEGNGPTSFEFSGLQFGA